MSTCEKCWADSFMSGDSQIDRYQELLKRRHGTPCTPEQQAGAGATMCRKCNRMTMHQVTDVCVICGYEYEE